MLLTIDDGHLQIIGVYAAIKTEQARIEPARAILCNESHLQL